MRTSVAIVLMCLGVGCQSPPPPVMATVPAFQLVDQNGAIFRSETWAGQPYVASFFFTSCATICPRIMGGVRSALAEASHRQVPLRALSITVDPDTDTVSRLATYATKEVIDGATWRLLTGTKPELERIVIKGFLAYMGEREPLEGGLFEIGHEGRMMLIDGQGQLRGLCEPDPTGISALVDAAGRL